MKRLFQLAAAIIFLSIDQSFAQIYTDQVQVVEGLGGKVGIGITPAQYRLHVEGNDPILKGRGLSAAIKLRNTSYSESTIGYGFFEHDAYGDVLLGATRSDDPVNLGYLRLYAGGTEKLSVTGDGRVGIGTSNPSGILHLNSQFPQLYLTGMSAAIRGNGDTWLFGYGGPTGSEEISVGTQDNTGSRTLTLAAGGYPRVKIKANGYVGISTSEPSSQLQITSNIERETLRIYKSGNSNNYLSIWQGVGGAVIDPIGTGILYLGYDQATNVIMGKDGGRVGIGTSSPETKLEVLGTFRVLSDGTFAGPNLRFQFFSGGAAQAAVKDYLSGDRRNIELNNGWGSWRLVAAGDFNIVNWNGNYYDAFYIKADNGYVGIGTTTPSQKLSVNGNASKSSAGDWLANSDARLKKNIVQLSSDETLGRMLQLKGVTYEWADDKTGIDRPQGIQYGFTAQNIQEVFPSLVLEDNLGYLQAAYSTYDAMLVESLRALNDKIVTLENENTELNVRLLKAEESIRQLTELVSAQVSKESTMNISTTQQ